jgi:hypothetical protein
MRGGEPSDASAPSSMSRTLSLTTEVRPTSSRLRPALVPHGASTKPAAADATSLAWASVRECPPKRQVPMVLVPVLLLPVEGAVAKQAAEADQAAAAGDVDEPEQALANSPSDERNPR